MFRQYERLSGSRKIDRIGRARTSKLGIEGLRPNFELLVIRESEVLSGPLLLASATPPTGALTAGPLSAIPGHSTYCNKYPPRNSRRSSALVTSKLRSGLT